MRWMGEGASCDRFLRAFSASTPLVTTRPSLSTCPLQSMVDMGNSRARRVYEAHLPETFRRPQTDQYPYKNKWKESLCSVKVQLFIYINVSQFIVIFMTRFFPSRHELKTQFQFNVEHDSLIFKLLFVPIRPCSEIIIRSDSSALLKCHLTLWSRSLSTAGAVLSLRGGGEGRGDICVINISSICSYFHQQTTEINNPQFKMLFNSWSVIWQACVCVCVVIIIPHSFEVH